MNYIFDTILHYTILLKFTLTITEDKHDSFLQKVVSTTKISYSLYGAKVGLASIMAI